MSEQQATDEGNESQKTPAEKLCTSEETPSRDPVLPDASVYEDFDLAKLQDALRAQICKLTSGDGANAHGEMLEEIAEDLLAITEGLKGVQTALQELALRVEHVYQIQQNASFQVGKELDAMRRELLGDRKALAARGTFNAILPTLGTLVEMQRGLQGEEHEQIRAQIHGIICSLRNLIQSLGFSEFSPAKGDPFDPTAMECDGYAEGPEGVVLQVMRAGYRVGDAVVRPAGVLLAEPQGAGADEVAPGSAPTDAVTDTTEQKPE
jgi:molecular chaperone GrpE